MTDPSRKRPLLAVLFLGVLIAALDIAMVGPALPALRDYYSVDERAIAWVLNIFVLFNLMGVPLMSKLADTRGRRLVFVLDLSIFAAGALIVAAAPPFWVLLLGRALQGLGAAGVFPVSSAVIGDTFPPESQGRALGVLGSVFGVAFLIGPAMSGIILQFSWRWLFVITPALAGIAIIVGRRHVPQRLGDKPSSKFDYRGLVLFTIAVAAIAFGLNGIDAIDFVSSIARPRVWLMVGFGAVTAGLYFRNARNVQKPLVSPKIFESLQARLALMLTVAAGFCEAVIIFVPSVAEATFAVSKSVASFMFLPLAGAVALGSPAFGWILDRIGARKVVMVSSVFLSSGLWLVATFETLPAFYAGTVMIGIALGGLLGSSLNYIILRESRLEDRVTAQGIVTLSLNVGLLIGGAVVGALAASDVTRREGYETAYFVIAVLGLAMFGISFLLKRRTDERELMPPELERP